jgi:crotonobetainyl-CoA:carnitine CoA-transferase CaiB-like acyl-CoA transferase
VADFTWYLAGPATTRTLAAMGAEVLKLEWTGKLDVVRYNAPFVTLPGEPAVDAYRPGGDPSTVPTPNRSGCFNHINAGKLGVSLNMRHPRGKALFRHLAALCDVVIENFSAGTMARWGLGYEQLRELRPDLIYIQASGFGNSGPYRDYVTIGQTAQAYSGLTAQSGLPEPFPPAGWGTSYLDHIGSYFNTMAVLAALFRRRATGAGAYVDLSQITAGLQVTGSACLDFSANARAYRRTGNRSPHVAAAPHGAYPAAGEDRWLAISVDGDAEWAAMKQALGDPTALDDPRFATLSGRVAHQDALDAAVGAVTAGREPFALMRTLQAAGVAAGVVQRPSQRLADPQLAADDHFLTLQHPEMGPRTTENVPVHLSAASVRTGGAGRRAAPCLGEHDRFVYTELLGLDGTEIEALRAGGVIL